MRKAKHSPFVEGVFLLQNGSFMLLLELDEKSETQSNVNFPLFHVLNQIVVKQAHENDCCIWVCVLTCIASSMAHGTGGPNWRSICHCRRHNSEG